MTREELIERLSNSLSSKIELTLPQFTALINSANETDKLLIMAAVNKGDGTSLSDIITRLVRTERKAKAITSINQAIKNNTIDLDLLTEAL